jgi:Tol biopolymer transport system component
VTAEATLETPFIGTDTPEPTETPDVTSTPVGEAQSIAFVSDRSGVPQIYLSDTEGRNEKQLTTEAGGACQPDWSPDGTQLIFTSPCKSLDNSYDKTSIFRINADGSGRTSLTKVPGGDFDPAWSPDGQHIMVTSLQDRRPHIYIMDANGDNRVLLSPSGAVDSQARWSPAGDRIVFVSKVDRQIIFTSSINPEKLQRQEFSTVPNTDTMSPDWSVDDYILYITNYPSQVVIFKLDSRFNMVELSPKFSKASAARFSPDGKWVLFDMNLTDNYDIYLMPIVGAQEPRRITSHRANESDPAWRPIAGSS